MGGACCWWSQKGASDTVPMQEKTSASLLFAIGGARVFLLGIIGPRARTSSSADIEDVIDVELADRDTFDPDVE